MYLLPCSLRGKQFDMVALVAVLLGRVYEVGDAARFLLEAICKNRVYLKAHILLGVVVGIRIDDAYVIFVIDMAEVAATGMHLAPCAVGAT